MNRKGRLGKLKKEDRRWTEIGRIHQTLLQLFFSHYKRNKKLLTYPLVSMISQSFRKKETFSFCCNFSSLFLQRLLANDWKIVFLFSEKKFFSFFFIQRVNLMHGFILGQWDSFLLLVICELGYLFRRQSYKRKLFVKKTKLVLNLMMVCYVNGGCISNMTVRDVHNVPENNLRLIAFYKMLHFLTYNFM